MILKQQQAFSKKITKTAALLTRTWYKASIKNIRDVNVATDETH